MPSKKFVVFSDLSAFHIHGSKIASLISRIEVLLDKYTCDPEYSTETLRSHSHGLGSRS